jgi:hypothetical protein
MENRLFTEKELAKMLGISKRTLQMKRYYGGGIPYLKIGRNVRYARSPKKNSATWPSVSRGSLGKMVRQG